MILSKNQAEAVYSAMCALNNIGAKLDVQIPEGGGLAVHVYEGLRGAVFVTTERGSLNEFADQADFAAAYSLA